MKLATRFTLLSFATAVTAGVVLIASLLFWEFQTRKALWISAVETNLAMNPSWPVMIHFQSGQAAIQELEFLKSRIAGTAVVSAYHLDGSLFAQSPEGIKPPAQLERNLQARLDTQTSYVGAGDLKQERLPDWFLALPLPNSLLVVSVPILSPVNPLDVDVSYDEYRQRLAGDNGTGARFVTGFVEAGISTQQLIWDMKVAAGQVLTGVTVLLLLALLVIRMVAHSISRPLAEIAQVAQAITDDDLPKKTRLPVHRGDEIGEIATVLNGVIEGMHRMKAKLDVDRTLLSMKVEATTRKLSSAEEDLTRTQSQIKRVAYFDAVTGLPNRRLMLEQLSMLLQIAARERKHLGVVLIDINNLRRINETMGREAGDRLLREISNRMVDTMRQSDVISRDETPQDISRVGNDEFCVLLHGISSEEDAQTAAARLTDVLKRPFDIEGQLLPIKFNAGVALAPDHARRPEELVRAADVALNHARARGITEPAVYSRDMDETGSERFQLENDLRNANFDKQFQLLYQPQINCETGQIAGAEALIRWHHPQKGVVPPFKFIPIAEESGQIIDLGNWILHRACKDFIALREQGIALPKVSVNVSAAQLTAAFVDEVRRAVDQYGMQSGELELELTEGLLVQNVDTVMQRLKTLKHEIGVRLSVDDFGTGYSSLAYLSRFPLDELKVDRSFVLAMEQDEAAAKVTGAIIAIGRELALEVVVEGVETTTQCQRMQSLGGSIIQGYLFSKPLPLMELETYIQQRSFSEVLEALKAP